MQVVTVEVNRIPEEEIESDYCYQYRIATPLGDPGEWIDLYPSEEEARAAAISHWQELVLEIAAVMPSLADILRQWTITPEDPARGDSDASTG